MKLIFWDIESTGLNFWQHGIHQIAGIIEIDGAVVESFDFKVRPNPKAKIDQAALDVAHVTVDQIMAYPPMEEIYRKLTAILAQYVDKFNKKDKFFTVGFNNASFDNPFLRAWFKQNGDEYFGSWFWSAPIDVMTKASEALMADRPAMENFKLMTVAKHVGIEIDETKLHDAGYDVDITRDIFRRLNKLDGRTGERKCHGCNNPMGEEETNCGTPDTLCCLHCYDEAKVPGPEFQVR